LAARAQEDLHGVQLWLVSYVVYRVNRYDEIEASAG